MENTLKINVFGKSILFCKYLWNRSLDCYEVLFGGQLLSCELKFKFHKDRCINARALAIKRARAHSRLERAHLCTDLYEKNFGGQLLSY